MARKERAKIPAYMWLVYVWSAGSFAHAATFARRRDAVAHARAWCDNDYTIEKFHRCTGPGR